LFLAFPIEKAYLLPIVPSVLLLFSLVGPSERRWRAALIVAVASANLVAIEIARPDTPGAATGAQFGVWVAPGDQVREIDRRWLLRDVDTMEGYVDTLRADRRRRGLGPSAELEALARPAVRSSARRETDR